MQHLSEVTAPAVQGTRSIPIPVLAAGWSGGGELLGVETHVSGQSWLCTCDAGVAARDHGHPNPSGAGAAPGAGLSSQPEWEDAVCSLSRRGFGRACSPLFIDIKARFTLLERLFSPQLMVPDSFPVALLSLLSSPGSRIRSSCVLPYTKPSRCCQGQILTRRA